MGFRVHADVLMQEKTSMLPEKIFKGPNSGFGNPRVMVSGTSLWPRACVTGPACLSAADDIPDGPYGVLRTDTVRCFPYFCYFCWANGGHCRPKHVPIIPGTNGALLELLSSNARVNVASNSIVNCRSVPGVITVRPSESTPRSSGSSIEP
ncbi:hypothetical protein BDP67DRAFT_492369 [Colletotrichum lupini]|nr:hypothetical protein BDP67DRAFT_492369 [Colletotrichum lupini]